jgi:hypothetical protein
MKKFLNHLFLILWLLGIVSTAQAQTSFVDRFTGSVVASIGKQPVVAATTANISLSGSQTIDGVVVSDHTNDSTGKAPDRVLVKNQTDTTQNGIYVVNNSGAWVRAQDFSGPSGVVKGQLVMVASGSTNQGFWTLTTSDPVSIDGVGGQTPSNVTFVATSIPVTNLALTNADLFVGNGSNTAVGVPLSGDCTISNAGAITCTKTNGVAFSSSATVPVINGDCQVGVGGQWVAGSCTGPTGSGTVNTATSGQFAVYPSSSNSVSGSSSVTTGTYALNVVQAASNQAYFGSTGSNPSHVVIDNAAGTQDSMLDLQNGGATQFHIFYYNAGGSLRIQESANNRPVLDYGVSSRVLNLGNAQNFNIDQSGNVGIGGASSGSYALNVQQAGAGQAYFGSTGSHASQVVIDNAAGSQSSNVWFKDAGTAKWYTGNQTDNSYQIVDVAGNKTVLKSMSNNGTLSLGAAQTTTISNAGVVSFGAHNNSTPGYTRITDGMILQWGISTVTAGTSLSVSLPVTFPNNAFSITTGTTAGTDATAFKYAQASFTSTSAIELSVNTGTTYVYWMAIGN